MRAAGLGIVASGLVGAAACHTGGSDWMAQPLPGDSDEWATPGSATEPSSPPEPARPRTGAATEPRPKAPAYRGRVLGKFRNTYYDFPSEADHQGAPVALRDAKCGTIKLVPRGFYETVCVQGSGTLKTGVTVSFARRDCDCAATCPRTDQKICFDALDRERFPWGRGAIGKPITPLLTVAVDDSVIPMGSAVFIPEYVGLPRGPEADAAKHDGCFVAQDRGSRVVGKHVDVFTGTEATTRLWNELVPSNEGVTVVLDSPRCARATEKR